MIDSNALQFVLVTPETTLRDEPVKALRFPLYDGQIGILPGRAPMVGRLGYGELLVTDMEGMRHCYYVDGGFVQVKGSVVSILTDRALVADQISARDTEKWLHEVNMLPAVSDAEIAARQRDQERARKMLALARKS